MGKRASCIARLSSVSALPRPELRGLRVCYHMHNSPVIKSLPDRVEVVKSEKIIRDRTHCRGNDGRRQRFAALNRSRALDSIRSAIAEETETPDNDGNQACCRQERKRQQPTPDQAADRNSRCSRSEAEDQHDRKG